MENLEMGLDTVELVMEIEDAFSIAIPDDEASRMLTVGDVYQFIIAQTNLASNSSICLSALAFRSLRRAALSLGVKDRLRPRDSTLRLLPETNRRDFWAELQKSAELTLPKLRQPPWIVAVESATVLLLTIAVGFIYRLTQSQVVSILAASAFAISIGWALSIMTVPFAVLPRKDCSTLRGLTEAVLGLNFKKLAERYDGAKDVWIALRAIIVEQLGVSPDAVTPEASFVNDLGCD